jgi:hypothetical protein
MEFMAFFEVVCIPYLYPVRPKTQRKAGKRGLLQNPAYGGKIAGFEV